MAYQGEDSTGVAHSFAYYPCRGIYLWWVWTHWGSTTVIISVLHQSHLVLDIWDHIYFSSFFFNFLILWLIDTFAHFYGHLWSAFLDYLLNTHYYQVLTVDCFCAFFRVRLYNSAPAYIRCGDICIFNHSYLMVYWLCLQWFIGWLDEGGHAFH